MEKLSIALQAAIPASAAPLLRIRRERTQTAHTQTESQSALPATWLIKDAVIGVSLAPHHVSRFSPREGTKPKVRSPNARWSMEPGRPSSRDDWRLQSPEGAHTQARAQTQERAQSQEGPQNGREHRRFEYRGRAALQRRVKMLKNRSGL